MSINTTTINRIKRVIGEIAANATNSTSPGPWYMSHGHVISPGKKLPVPPGQRFAPQAAYDVCSTPSGKDHTVYGKNPATDYGRGDMRHITTCEPVRMVKLAEDVQSLLDERGDLTALACVLDDLINNTIGGNDDPRAKALGEAVEAYLSSAP